MRPTSRLVALLLATQALAACSDSTGPGGELTVRFLANGALVEFDDQESLHGSFGARTLVVSGYQGISNFGIQVHHTSPVVPGTYSGYSDSGGTVVGVLLHYQPEGGTLYGTDTSTPVQATVTVTEISPSRVRGTFTGTLSASGHADLVITDGQFVVARLN